MTRGRLAKLIVRYENGDPERVIEFDPRAAPFQHDGQPASILDENFANQESPLNHNHLTISNESR